MQGTVLGSGEAHVGQVKVVVVVVLLDRLASKRERQKKLAELNLS